MVIGNIIWGFIFIVLGTLGLKYNFQIVNAFGRNNVFERRLGAGTTYPVFKLFAVLIVVFGVLMVFGFHDNVLEFLFSPLTDMFSL